MKNKGLSVLLSFFLVLMLSISFSVPVYATTISNDIISSDDLERINSSISGTFSPGNPNPTMICYLESSVSSLDDSLINDQVYRVDFSLNLNIKSSLNTNYNNFYFLKFSYGTNILYSVDSLEGSSTTNSYNVNNTGYFYSTGLDLKNSKFSFIAQLLSTANTARTITVDYDFTSLSFSPVSSSESSDYESGYNAGYSAGLLDGEASVDTETIRNEAYQAGYEAGFADGSDDTLKEDKVLLETVSNEFTLPGQVINNYYQQYITGPSLSIANGGLTYTMYVPMGYLFEVGKDYLIDLRNVTVSNSNEEIEVSLGDYVSHYISSVPSFYLSGPGLSMSARGELIYSPNQTGDFNLRVTVPAELVLRSTYTDAIENDYVDIPSYGYAYGILNWDSTFNYVIDVYEIDIVEEIDYLRDLSNKMGDSNNLQQDTIDSIDNLTDTTKQQTDQLTNGYDSSSMSSSNAALSGSIAEYDQTEVQITDQSTGFIDGVTFYDLNMQPQLLTCITFCSSWLQSLFVNLGDWGILVMVSLSLGLGLMLIGWFKYRK